MLGGDTDADSNGAVGSLRGLPKAKMLRLLLLLRGEVSENKELESPS